jgi:hypothetical protein
MPNESSTLQSLVDDWLAGERRALEVRGKLLKEIAAMLQANAPKDTGVGKLQS